MRKDIFMPEVQGYEEEEDNLVLGQALYLKELLTAANLEGISVNTRKEHREAAFFHTRHVLGVAGFNDVNVVTLVSSGAKKMDLSEKPYSFLLVAPQKDRLGLLVDDETNEVWTDSFWLLEDGVLKYVDPSEPIHIDRLNTMSDHQRVDVETIPAFNHNKRLAAVTENKALARIELQRGGVLVPEGVVLSEYDDEVRETIDLFIEENPNANGYVLKGLEGVHGSGVILFFPEDKDDLYEIAPDKIEREGSQLLEERIVAKTTEAARRNLLVTDEEGKKVEADELDFNLRMLVALSTTSPKTITGEVRYRENDGAPVNLTHKSFKAYASELAALEDPELIQRVEKVAEDATRVICNAALAPGETSAGYAGVDLITDPDGRIYVLEVNSGLMVGGLGTLARLRGKPIAEVRERMIPFLLESLPDTPGSYATSPHKLRRLKMNSYDKSVVIRSYQGVGDEEAEWVILVRDVAPQILKKNSSPESMINMLHVFEFKVPEFSKLLKYIEDELEKDPQDEYFITIKERLLKEIDDELTSQNSA